MVLKQFEALSWFDNVALNLNEKAYPISGNLLQCFKSLTLALITLDPIPHVSLVRTPVRNLHNIIDLVKIDHLPKHHPHD